MDTEFTRFCIWKTYSWIAPRSVLMPVQQEQKGLAQALGLSRGGITTRIHLSDEFYKYLPTTSETMIYVAMIHLMVRRLTSNSSRFAP